MSKWTWRNEPELMQRLGVAQNGLEAPIDIMTFVGFMTNRDELERHVIHYEGRVAKQEGRS